jgi:UDP-N-acetylglucosamine--N-acetylmuramyl-(pentapeptide) pyrophosphoryl-undecaprenol N-acetylglucosamine transferase
MTLAELMCAGVPSVLVPLPHAADNHQALTAQYLIAAKAAVLCEQADLATGQLIALLSSLDADRSRLLAMAQAARQLGRSDAAAEIVTVLCEVGSGQIV